MNCVLLNIVVSLSIVNSVLWNGGSDSLVVNQVCFHINVEAGFLYSAVESWMTFELSFNGKDKLI